MAPAVTATHIHDRDNLADQFISRPAGGDFGLPIDRLDHTSGTRRTTRYDAGRIALGKALVCVSNRCAAGMNHTGRVTSSSGACTHARYEKPLLRSQTSTCRNSSGRSPSYRFTTISSYTSPEMIAA